MIKTQKNNNDIEVTENTKNTTKNDAMITNMYIVSLYLFGDI